MIYKCSTYYKKNARMPIVSIYFQIEKQKYYRR